MYHVWGSKEHLPYQIGVPGMSLRATNTAQQTPYIGGWTEAKARTGPLTKTETLQVEASQEEMSCFGCELQLESLGGKWGRKFTCGSIGDSSTLGLTSDVSWGQCTFRSPNWNH